MPAASATIATAMEDWQHFLSNLDELAATNHLKPIDTLNLKLPEIASLDQHSKKKVKAMVHAFATPLGWTIEGKEYVAKGAP